MTGSHERYLVQFTVASHDSCLATNDDQDATVAENEDENLKEKDEKLNEKEKGDVPDAVCKCGSGAAPERIKIADSIHHVARAVDQSHVVYNTADPCDCRCRDFDPIAQQFLTPRSIMMNHLQVELDCDAHKIDLNTIY